MNICQECGKEYRGNKGGKYCSQKCREKNRPSQYKKMKEEVQRLREWQEFVRYNSKEAAYYADEHMNEQEQWQ